MNETSDSLLIANYLNGDEKSLEILIERHLKSVYYLVYQYVGSEQDAQDITQETFIRAWRNLKKFDQQKNFKTWVFVIAKHAAIDVLKKKKVVMFSAFEDEHGGNSLLETLADEAPRADVISEQKGTMEILTKAMAPLSPAYKKVLSLRYYEDMTFSNISEVLHEPLDTVKSRHRRAVFMLKKILEGGEFASRLSK